MMMMMTGNNHISNKTKKWNETKNFFFLIFLVMTFLAMSKQQKMIIVIIHKNPPIGHTTWWRVCDDDDRQYSFIFCIHQYVFVCVCVNNNFPFSIFFLPFQIREKIQFEIHPLDLCINSIHQHIYLSFHSINRSIQNEEEKREPSNKYSKAWRRKKKFFKLSHPIIIIIIHMG